MKSIIFDLDLTLVDTTCLERARSKRNWQEAYRLIPQTRLYPGIKELFNCIKNEEIKSAIVSTFPRTYIEVLVKYYNMPIDVIVGYYDAKPIKPHPAPMLKAIDLLRESTPNVISFGDRAIDIQASNAVGIESVVCLWGQKKRNCY